MKTLCCIFNYGHSENALKWFDRCKDNWETFIMDTYVKSGHDDILLSYNDERVIFYDNIFCGGLTIEAFKKAIEKNADFLLIINSDVEIDDENFNNLLNSVNKLPSTVGIYEVSATKGSSVMGMVGPQYETAQYYSKGDFDFKFGGYGEGWLYGINSILIKRLLPYLSLSSNKYGWGIGRDLIELSKKENLLNIIDNNVFVYHPAGTGYDGNKAFSEWYEFDKKSEKIGIPYHFITIGYCSRSHNPKFYLYLNEIFIDKAQIIEKICNEETKLTITKAYNEIINEARYDTILLVHDDIEFINVMYYLARPKYILPELFLKYPDYGIIGIAPRCILDKDIIQRTYEPEYFFEEADYDKDVRFEYSNGNLSPYFLEVSEDVMVDGMFIALRRDRIKSLFNEENKTFHYYDIEFCLSNYLKGIKVGITKAFLIRHKINDDSAYEELKRLKPNFIERWKNYLPIIK